MSYLASISLGFLLVSSPVSERPADQEESVGVVSSNQDQHGASLVNVESRLATRYVVPKTLDRNDIDEGFLGVSMSVSQCMGRHMKREGESPASKVEVKVTVGRDGKVSRVRLPRRVRRTIFGTCMRAHSKRWRFPPFTGRPIQVKKKFVLR